MLQSKLLIPTLRDAPSEADVVSHQLMLRAGLIRPLAAGIYTYLPLGWRVLRKVSSIIREEMDRIGAQEMLMPAMQPAELWQQSGRYSLYGPELVRLYDRHNREFALGPTHEEVITSLIRDEVNSYRKLPMILYQIQTKFRDERRPRYGLLRGREFMMKDAYSFDADWESLDETYRNVYYAYTRIFDRCGLTYRVVEADAGTIGGEGETHEFMALADIGEDTVAVCANCSYSANLETAYTRHGASPAEARTVPKPEKIHTPGVRTIDQLTASLDIEAGHILKTLIYMADGRPVAVIVRGDHEVNETKLKNALRANHIELANEEIVRQHTGAPTGFAGPVGLSLPLWIDQEAAIIESGVAGANEPNYHLRYVVPGRDFPLEHIGDYRNVTEGDSCPHCEGTFKFYRGIEVGHVFKLGTKYSAALGAGFLNAAGRENPVIMGCYGIGVSRILSAVIEQNHDDGGILWPMAIAPFHVHLIPVSVQDPVQRGLAEKLYYRLQAEGMEVLMDDREERPGVKFKDSDLIGIPIRIIVGKQAGEGLVEIKERGQAAAEVIGYEDVVTHVLGRMKS
ncbi:proline--tRNA ligase [Paenibacillus sp. 32O-W]|uniref:proline--tRNA ligase n=1 Tax=Paenibacillus sp. 32O-W TaxID=1695218 RepID=UPI00119E6C68|nr:proline--tRNA ligase [Paenibacillus sp. 32O-W]